jgi:hypothetical protein
MPALTSIILFQELVVATEATHLPDSTSLMDKPLVSICIDLHRKTADSPIGFCVKKQYKQDDPIVNLCVLNRHIFLVKATFENIQSLK